MRRLVSFDSSVWALAEEVLGDLEDAVISLDFPEPGTFISPRYFVKVLFFSILAHWFYIYIVDDEPTLHDLFDISLDSAYDSVTDSTADLLCDLLEVIDPINTSVEDSSVDLRCYETLPPSPLESNTGNFLLFFTCSHLVYVIIL